MGVSKNMILLGASAATGGILFISYTLDLDRDYDAAGDMAFVAIPTIMLVMGTFWATSEIYSSTSSNTMKMRGVSAFLTILLGAYLAYLIIAYKDSAKNPIIVPGHGTRTVGDIDGFSFFMDHQINFRDDDGASYSAADQTAILTACDEHLANPTADTLKKCSLFSIDSKSGQGCAVQADGITVKNCFSTLKDNLLTAEFTVSKPTFEKYDSGRVKTVQQQVNVKFTNARFKSFVTDANCYEVKYSADPECTYGFRLPWKFQDDMTLPASLKYKTKNADGTTWTYGDQKKYPTSMQITVNNAIAKDSTSVASTNFDLYTVDSKYGGKSSTFFLTDWTANIDLANKETLTWAPRKFFSKVERSQGDINWEVYLAFITKKSDLTLPVEVREESVRLPFFTIFTALMAFLTPLGAIFGFFYPNIFPKRYAAFGERPVFFDRLDKDAGGSEEHE